MNKLIFIVMFLFFISCSLIAQDNNDIEKVFNKRILHWEEVSYNASSLIPKYFNEDKFDSLNLVFDYWIDKVGRIEPIVRFEILYSIYNNNFDDRIINESIYYYLLEYRSRMETKGYGSNSDWCITNFNYVTGYAMLPYLNKEFLIQF